MSGNLLVRFDEGRVGRMKVSPSLLLYRETRRSAKHHQARANEHESFRIQLTPIRAGGSPKTRL